MAVLGGASLYPVQGLMTVGVAIGSLLLASCTADSRPPVAAPGVTAQATGEPIQSGGPGCSRVVTSFGRPTEIRGDAGDAQLYGLVSSRLPVSVGEVVKIVWRMTGSGPLTATASGPDGAALTLEFGPESHPSSNYARPGAEWGTGYRFNQPGCWRLGLDRADTHGEFWMVVNA